MGATGTMRSAATLAAIAATCTALVATTWALTKTRIADNERAYLERSLAPVLSGLAFDGGVGDAPHTIPAPHDLPGTGDALVYRVYAAGSPVAALFVVTAPGGYSGPIRLLVGVDAKGVVTGIHVLEHRETPGLGDLVETGKSDWAGQFAGRHLGNPAPAAWKVRRDGGQFDQLTGATVTPRAIVAAVRETLQYFETHRVAIFAAPADGEDAG
jgi:electron transport complex protein RnfG